MQQAEFRRKVIESINTSLGNIPITTGMRGHTFHSVGLVHVHVQSNRVTPEIIELTCLAHGSPERIGWLKDFTVLLTVNGREVAGTELEPDPAHEGGLKARLNAKYLRVPGKLQIAERG